MVYMMPKACLKHDRIKQDNIKNSYKVKAIFLKHLKKKIVMKRILSQK